VVVGAHLEVGRVHEVLQRLQDLGGAFLEPVLRSRKYFRRIGS
jgi:hypothetical protein